MINLTDSALNAVRNAISAANKPSTACASWSSGRLRRLQIQSGSGRCDRSDDTVIERDGVRLFVDNKSHEYLVGTPSILWWRSKVRASPSKIRTQGQAAAAASRSAEVLRAAYCRDRSFKSA